MVTFIPTSQKGRVHGRALGDVKARLPRGTQAPFLVTFLMRDLVTGSHLTEREAGVCHLSHSDFIFPAFVTRVPHKGKLLRNSGTNVHMG